MYFKQIVQYEPKCFREIKRFFHVNKSGDLYLKSLSKAQGVRQRGYLPYKMDKETKVEL